MNELQVQHLCTSGFNELKECSNNDFGDLLVVFYPPAGAGPRRMLFIVLIMLTRELLDPVLAGDFLELQYREGASIKQRLLQGLEDQVRDGDFLRYCMECDLHLTAKPSIEAQTRLLAVLLLLALAVRKHVQ